VQKQKNNIVSSRYYPRIEYILHGGVPAKTQESSISKIPHFGTKGYYSRAGMEHYGHVVETIESSLSLYGWYKQAHFLDVPLLVPTVWLPTGMLYYTFGGKTCDVIVGQVTHHCWPSYKLFTFFELLTATYARPMDSMPPWWKWWSQAVSCKNLLEWSVGPPAEDVLPSQLL
jgi:hypothetical protein